MKHPFLLLFALFITLGLGLASAQKVAKRAIAAPVPATLSTSSQALLHNQVLPAIQPALPQPAQGTRVLFECERVGGFTSGPYTERTWILHVDDGGNGYQLGIRYSQTQWAGQPQVTELYVKVLTPQDTLNLFLAATAIPTNWASVQSLGQICDLPATRLTYNDGAQETLLRYECGPATLPPANAQSLAFRDVFSDVKTDITDNPDLFLNW